MSETLAPSTVVTVDGAAGAGWLRVRLPDLRVGYVTAASVESAERPIARAAVAAGRPVRARPAPDAPALALASGRDVPVFGRFGAYRLVELDAGRRGWIDAE